MVNAWASVKELNRGREDNRNFPIFLREKKLGFSFFASYLIWYV